MSLEGNRVELVGYVVREPTTIDKTRSRMMLRRGRGHAHDYFLVTFADDCDRPCVLNEGDRVRVLGRLETLSKKCKDKWTVAIRAVRIERWAGTRWVGALRSLPCPPAPTWGPMRGIA